MSAYSGPLIKRLSAVCEWMLDVACSIQQEQVSDKVVQLLRSYLNCIFDHVMTCTTQKLSFRLKYWDRVVTDCDFADNIALVTKSESQLLMALNTLLDESARTGLSIYWEKTKIMVLQPKSDTDKSNYLVTGNHIETVDHFTSWFYYITRLLHRPWSQRHWLLAQSMPLPSPIDWAMFGRSQRSNEPPIWRLMEGQSSQSCYTGLKLGLQL